MTPPTPAPATLNDWQRWLREYGERRWGKHDDNNSPYALQLKLYEECGEVIFANRPAQCLAELGDVLVVVLRLIDALGGDAEAVIRDTAKKLMARVEEA